MAKNINVKLTFSADTKAAQQQLSQLQQTLSNVAATPVIGSGLKASKTELQEATTKALELKVALQNATNVKTGKLNFGKFSQELKHNKMTLEQYAMQLQKLGPQGVKAFSQLATSIRQAETPLVAMQGRMAALGRTFMNTVKWSISSSLIQGVTNAFTSTIDYAKELNETLNDIRIVTGKSVSGVGKFAQEANKAAKALSATTDEYAKASLIYFQQGLNESEVAARTETTLKLAKVVGVEAQTASEWMTAIWNNFDDGSRSLENYADVLAKLGAATASSADEIAGGLEKFAAVSETVGLSYEYAASALATITAETRQSEDVVGTALKTIFARVENLKLGETLEDGTNLGQYSEALAKVGVNIKDGNGELKEMDDILDGIGAQWQILNKDQQVALAQSVAGIRQYNQFMALMDNWDVMKDNVEMAREANGALEDQHEIWETGIAGATNRVKEELNEIKNSLLDENDLLPLLNVAEGFLDFVGDLVDSLGGLPGLLSIIASIGLKIWGPQAATMLQSMVSNVQLLYGGLSGKTQQEKSAMVTQAKEAELTMTSNASGIGNTEMGARNEILRTEVDLTNQLEQKRNELNSHAKEQLNLLQQIFEQQKLITQETAKQVDDTELEALHAEEKLKALGPQKVKTTKVLEEDETGTKIIQEQEEQIEIDQSQIDDLARRGQAIGKADSFESFHYGFGDSGNMLKDAHDLITTGNISENEESYQKLKTEIEGGGQYKNEDNEVAKQRSKGLKQLEKEEAEYQKLKKNGNALNKTEAETYKKLSKEEKARTTAIKKSRAEIQKQQKTLAGNVRTTNDATNTIKDLSKGNKDLANGMQDVVDANKKNAKATGDYGKQMDAVRATGKTMQDMLDDNANSQKNWTTTVVDTMQGVASTAAGVQMIIGAVDSLSTAIADGSAGFSDYLSAIVSLTFALPTLVQGISSVSKVLKLDVLWKKLSAAASKKLSAETLKEAAAEQEASGKKLKAKITNAMASIAEWAAKGPAGWIIAGISAAIVSGLIGMSIAIGNKKAENKQQEESDNKSIEKAENALEVAEGWNTESQAMDDLIAKHNELKKANDQTIEGQKALKEAQQAIIDQVPQLIEKYKELDKEYENLDLSRTISILEGAVANNDIEQIEEITNEIDEKIAKETSKIAKEGQKGAMGRTAAAMAETKGSVKDDKYTVRVDGGDGYVNQLLKDSSISDNGHRINLDMSNSKEFLKDYEELQNIAKKAEEAGKTEESGYRKIKEILDASQEQYEKLKQLSEDGKLYEIQDQATKSGFDASNIQTYEDYIRVKDDLTSSSEMLKIATEEEIEAWLASQKALSEYSAFEKKAVALEEKYGTTLSQNMTDYAKSLTNKEDLTAFLKIDFDKFQTKEVWDGMVEYIKKLDEAEEISLNVDAIAAAEKNLKSNGSKEDYKKLQESINWGQDGFIDYSTFLNKSYAEQKAYLEYMKIETADLAEEKYKAALSELEDTKEQLEAKKELTEEEKVDLANVKQKIELAKVDYELSKLAAKQAKEAQQQRIRDFKKSKQDYEDEYDAYRHINEISDDLARTMERIGEAKEHAYGADYLALLDQEIKGLETENKLLDNTIALANKRAAANKKELTSSYGAKFDSFGNISNFNKIQGNYLQELAEIEAGAGKDSEEYKAKKAEYDDFIKLAEDYNEDLEKSEEATDKKAANMREILDKKLEGIEYKINIKLEVKQHELNILERQLGRLTDDAFDGAERIKNLTSQTSSAYAKQELNRSGIKDTLEAANVSEEDIAKYMAGNGDVLSKYNLSSSVMEQLETFTEGFIESQEQLEELSQAIKDEVMITFDAWHEKIEEVGAAIEAQMSVVESYKNIIDIVGKDKLGIDDATLKALEDASNIAAEASLTNAKNQKETTESALLNAQSQKALYEEGSEMYNFWAEQERALSQQLQEDTANFMSAWENALTTAYETFTAETERAIDNLSDYMAGANFGSMDELSKSFEWQQEVSDRYLENYEKAYELSKLNRKIQKDIDSTDNVRAQKVMRDMQKEIAEKQADGVELSQHDLEILQKKYDLKLAEIALEEAQSAKSVVRLQKNSDGSFGYVYTADQNNISNAEQNYEDKLYASQKSNEEYINSLSKQIIDNRKAMEEELASIDVTAYASKEEYLKTVNNITQKYQKKENYLLKEMQKTIASNKDIYNKDVQAYGTFVGQQEELSQTWVLNFENTAFSIATGFTTIEEAQQNLNNAIGNPSDGTGLLGSLDAAYTNLDSRISDCMTNAGTSISEFGTTVDTAINGEDGIIKTVKNLEQTSIDYANTAQNKFGENANAVNAWYETFGDKIQKGKEDVDNLEGSLAKLKDVSLKVKTEVKGKSEVDKLTTAIENVEKAILKLKNADFKITANIKITNEETDNKNNDWSEHTAQSQTFTRSITPTLVSGLGKGTKFEVLDKKGKDFVIYDETGKGKTYSATELDNQEFIRSDDNEYIGSDAKKYIKGTLDGKTYYIPLENVNRAGGSEYWQDIQPKYKQNAEIVLPIGAMHYPSYEKKNGTGVPVTLAKQTTKIKAIKYYNGEIWYKVDTTLYKDRWIQESAVKAPKSFDTGGYTGTWGPDGRLAMLHQKEIVLNAHDTENFLAAVDILRKLNEQLNLNALAMQHSDKLSLIQSHFSKNSDILEQNVHITAEFPNVTSHNEIEEAFKNLTNLASQYANRKN